MSGGRLGEVLSRWGGALSEKTGSCQQKADFIHVLQVWGRILPLSSSSRLRRGPDGISSTSLEPSPVTQEICTCSVLSKKGLSLRLHWFRSPCFGGTPQRSAHPPQAHPQRRLLAAGGKESWAPEPWGGGVPKWGTTASFYGNHVWVFLSCLGIYLPAPLEHVRR